MNPALVAMIPADGAPIAVPPRMSTSTLYDEYMRGLNKHTRIKYEYAWRLISTHNKLTIYDMVDIFLTQGPQSAKLLLWQFRNALLEREYGPSHVNTLVGGIAAVARFAHDLGLIQWKLVVPQLKRQHYRDTRGPEREAVERGFRKLASNPTQTGLRDHAMIRLFYNPALRANEVLSLDLGHYRDGQLYILGKGFKDRTWVTLPPSSNEAIRAWLEVRPNSDSPALFVTCQAGFNPRRVRYKLLRQIILRTMNCTPHALRHAGITHALDMSNGDIRAVQRFSRHSSPNTVLIYDDNRRDLAGGIANLIDIPALLDERPAKPKTTDE